jgi:prepilin-type N-terminal cleavage/methylation domain-containing protein
MRKSLLRRRKGFTLVELLIVIAIIAIISAIAIPKILNALYQAKYKKTMSGLRNIAIAIFVYSPHPCSITP